MILFIIGVLIFIPFYFLTKFALRMWRERKVRVNCHFCDTDSMVEVSNRNAFVCCNCDQYNGFTETGDYNRPIPSQYTPRLNWSSRPLGARVVKKERLDARINGIRNAYGTNSLCAQCNMQLTRKQRMLADFVASDESTYDTEISAYAQRLNRIFALCSKCEQMLQSKLAADKEMLNEMYPPRKSTPLLSVTPPTLQIARARSNTNWSGVTRGTRTDSPTISENENKSSSNRIYPGVISTTLHMFTISLMLFVFLVDLNSLQNDSDKRIVFIPAFVLRFVNVSFTSCMALCALAIVTQLNAMYLSKARLTINDLYLCIVLLAAMLLHANKLTTLLFRSTNDIHLLSTACSTLSCFLAAVVLLIPRKCLRSDKSKFSGCISLFDSPLSQTANEEHSSSQLWRQRSGDENSMEVDGDAPPDDLLNDDCESVRSSILSNRTNKRRSRGRGATPSRELAPRLDAISIGGSTFNNNMSQMRNVQRQSPVNDKTTDIIQWQRNSQISPRSTSSVNSTMSPPSISGSSIFKESRLNLVDVNMPRTTTTSVRSRNLNNRTPANDFLVNGSSYGRSQKSSAASTYRSF